MNNSLVRYDGGEILKSDIREDNLQNLYWRTQEGQLIRVGQLPDSHLRNIVLMLMGFGYTEYYVDDRMKLLWLTALKLEWDRRMSLRKMDNDIRRANQT